MEREKHISAYSFKHTTLQHKKELKKTSSERPLKNPPKPKTKSNLFILAFSEKLKEQKVDT